MKRDIMKTAEEGMKLTDEQHDLMTDELEELFRLARTNSDGLFKALSASYYAGLRTGMDMR